MSDKKTPQQKPSPRPAPLRESIKRGHQPSGPQGGHQPSTGQNAPTNPPSQGSGGKK